MCTERDCLRYPLISHTCDTLSTTRRTSLPGCTGPNDSRLAMLALILVRFGMPQYRSRYDWLGARCKVLFSFCIDPRLALVDVVGFEESGERMKIKGFSLSFEITVSARSRPFSLVSGGMRAGTRKSKQVARTEHAPAT